MITIQKYVRVQSLEEAYQLNQNRNNRILGGMLWLKMGTGSVNTAIDLSDLHLDTIEETQEHFSIGAMVTLRQLEQHPGLASFSQGTIAKALKDIVGVQFRNMATVGGSIWGRFGFSDVLTIFLAMDSYVELYKGGIVSLEEFSKRKYDNDILVRVLIKKVPGTFSYQSVRAQRTDFPILTCAISLLNGEYRTVIGARPGRARIVRDTNGILAKNMCEDNIRAFSSHVAKNIPTGTNSRGSSAYRTHLIQVLTARGLSEIGGAQCKK